MNHCSSHDWDRYCDDNDVPLLCPQCGKDNAIEGRWACQARPGFCSVECSDEYEMQAALDAEMEARELDLIEEAVERYWRENDDRPFTGGA